MNLNPLVSDGLIAAAIAGVVLILSPGVAFAAMLAAIVLVVCCLTLALDRRRARRSARFRRRVR